MSTRSMVRNAALAGALLVSGVLLGLLWGQHVIGLWALVALALSLFAASVLSYVAASARAAAQLRQITTALRALAQGDLEARLPFPRGRNDGLAGLIEAVASLHDALRQRVAEAEAKSTTLEAILTSMDDAVIATGRDGRIILFNPAAERLFQKSKSEAIGRSILEVVRNFELAQAFDSSEATGQMQLHEFQLLTPVERTLEARTAPIRTAKGERLGVLGVLHDITELRRLERVRSEFVANVSHELRTPLTSIKGFIETLLDGAMEDRATCRRFLEIVNKEANRLVALVHDLLDLSRVESRHFPLDLRPVDLAHLLEGCVHLFRGKAREKELEIATSLPAEPSFATVDEVLIRQVFVNLLDNAVKYTPPGGRVQVALEMTEHEVRVSISDTGMGIPEKHLSRIFERFYRVDKARSRELGGTGLGLSIVKHIVDRHAGRVEVASAVGEGTTFTVTLPRQPAAPPAPTAVSPGA